MFLQELSDQTGSQFDNADVRWVITVPAIWKMPAKQFMREAAYKVGERRLALPRVGGWVGGRDTGGGDTTAEDLGGGTLRQADVITFDWLKDRDTAEMPMGLFCGSLEDAASLLCPGPRLCPRSGTTFTLLLASSRSSESSLLRLCGRSGSCFDSLRSKDGFHP